MKKGIASIVLGARLCLSASSERDCSRCPYVKDPDCTTAMGKDVVDLLDFLMSIPLASPIASIVDPDRKAMLDEIGGQIG